LTKDDSIRKAYQHCRAIARNHYENFPVASFLIPARLRDHVYAVYAFARHADDLSDEKHDEDALNEWAQLLHQSLKRKVDHPILLALADTIHRFELPVDFFDRLILAFKQDLRKTRFQSFDELFAYCENSANPIGRIILYLNGYREKELLKFSDNICTSLQLTNFWQDVTIDYQKDRIYIPQDEMVEHQVTEAQIRDKIFNDDFKKLMKSLVDQTMNLFKGGLPLFERLHGRLKWELKFTIRGGVAILDKIAGMEYNVLKTRPVLNRLDWTKIGLNLAFNRNGML
jgi:squalene synthase HpnC